ncbi:MAG: hypothetical protein V8R82_02500 [Clostridia bacterium]
MATNPMQRKARNSFLLGMLITLVIAGAIIALLFIQLKNYKEKEQEEKANSVKVWVLGQDVISGQVITNDMLTQQVINKNVVPTNAFGNIDVLNNYSLEDKEGNEIVTEYKNNNSTMYLVKDNTKYELKQEDATGSYYIEKNREKEYVELATVPVIAKVDMNKNTVLTTEMVSKSNEKTTDDLRKVEYNVLTLPSQLQTGEYIDVRLALPSGQDYIVVSKKQVEIPQVSGVDVADTIWLKLTEDEIITMNNAIVDSARALGSVLKVTIYTEAGIQEAATPTYVPSREVAQLIQNNPNIVQESKNILINRYSNNSDTRNNALNSAINTGEEGEENLKTKVEESITNSKENRQKYLQSLGGDY